MIGDIISGGLKLLGGYLDRNAADERAAQKTAADYAMAKEFATTGIQMRVADAKAAGIHPLYAIGAPSFNAPTSTVGDVGIGSSLAGMGQDISRAVTATSGSKERLINEQIQNLQLRNLKLQGDVLESQSLKNRAEAQSQTGPALNLPGFGIGDKIKYDFDNPEKLPPLALEGYPWKNAPGWPNAEDVEKAYGDVIQELYGAVRFGRDSWHNMWPHILDVARHVNNSTFAQELRARNRRREVR